MITQHIGTITLIVGIMTASLFLQAFAPRFALRSFYGKDVSDEFALFLARAAGVPIAMIGLLLIWASFNEAIRDPIILAAVVGKSLFLFSIARNWKVTGKGFALTIIVDSIAVVLFLLYFLGL